MTRTMITKSTMRTILNPQNGKRSSALGLLPSGMSFAATSKSQRRSNRSRKKKHIMELLIEYRRLPDRRSTTKHLSETEVEADEQHQVDMEIEVDEGDVYEGDVEEDENEGSLLQPEDFLFAKFLDKTNVSQPLVVRIAFIRRESQKKSFMWCWANTCAMLCSLPYFTLNTKKDETAKLRNLSLGDWIANHGNTNGILQPYSIPSRTVFIKNV